jgi:hypothetical protein
MGSTELEASRDLIGKTFHLCINGGEDFMIWGFSWEIHCLGKWLIRVDFPMVPIGNPT